MKKGLQILTCFSQPNEEFLDYLECARHAILAYTCLFLLFIFASLLRKLMQNKKLKKRTDTTKMYLMSSLIVFDVLIFVHFGLYLDSNNWMDIWLKANL